MTLSDAGNGQIRSVAWLFEVLPDGTNPSIASPCHHLSLRCVRTSQAQRMPLPGTGKQQEHLLRAWDPLAAAGCPYALHICVQQSNKIAADATWLSSWKAAETKVQTTGRWRKRPHVYLLNDLLIAARFDYCLCNGNGVYSLLGLALFLFLLLQGGLGPLEQVKRI